MVVYRAAPDHVLNFKFFKLYWEPNSFDGFFVHLGSILAIFYALGSCDNHFTCFENESCGTGSLLHSHDDCSKSLGIILGISTLDSNVFEIETTVQIGR